VFSLTLFSSWKLAGRDVDSELGSTFAERLFLETGAFEPFVDRRRKRKEREGERERRDRKREGV